MALAGAVLQALATAAAGRPNVVLITVDTFRPDHIGYWGYAHDTTPSLDALSRQGVFFRQAFSSSAWTTPGLISILTSLYAPTHGVDVRHRSLDPEVVTLPDAMRQGGYRAPDIFFLTDIPNFANLGLERYPRRDELIDRGDDILFHWLETEATGDQPFFLYYHYRDVHLPYDAGEPYESYFLPGAFASRFGVASAARRFLAAEKLHVVKSNVMITRGLMDFTSWDRPWVSALYDAEIRRLDETFFSRLATALQRPELRDNTLVVISADHGEELLEHGLIGHVSTFKEGQLFDELTRIPLVLWYPRVLPGPQVVNEPVQCLDIMPTILELAGLPVPPGAQGRSLLPLIRGQEWTPRPLFFETTAGGFMADDAQYEQRFRAVRTARWKLVHAVTPDAHQLYDLEADPGEQHDVARRYPAVADSLRHLLQEWALYAQGRSPAPPAPSPVAAGPTALPAGPPVILFPQDGDTLGYAGAEHAVQLQWSGSAGAEYTVEYDVGHGAYHVGGTLVERSPAPRFGPFQPRVWNSLVLYSPFRFRVWRSDRPDEKSQWVTFCLGAAGGDAAAPVAAPLALRLGQGAAAVLTHARNLVWGGARGLADLYLWAAAVPAADLSAYALLACIAGAIAWPGVQRLGVARCRAWGAALLYIAFVYSTVPAMPAVWDALRQYTSGSVRYLGIVAVGAAAATVLVRLWRQVRWSDPRPYLALLAIGPAYAYLLDRYAVFPAERLHLVEYGFMGWVLFRALRVDLSAAAAYVVSLALTVVVGFGDECIQWVLPQRFFELADVQLNAVSGGLGLLVLRFVVRPHLRALRAVTAPGSAVEAAQ